MESLNERLTRIETSGDGDQRHVADYIRLMLEGCTPEEAEGVAISTLDGLSGAIAIIREALTDSRESLEGQSVDTEAIRR